MKTARTLTSIIYVGGMSEQEIMKSVNRELDRIQTPFSFRRLDGLDDIHYPDGCNINDIKFVGDVKDILQLL